MPPIGKKARTRRRWWAVRKDLDPSQASILMALSFILPLVLWSIACYGPWWKVRIR